MKMNNGFSQYETIYIIRPEQGDDVKGYIDRFKKIIEDLGATDTSVEEWGLRNLAYPIRKQGKGYYSLMRYQATRGTVEELERNLKLTEGVLRYLTVRVDEEVKPPAADGQDLPLENR
jgi:small subunit ribosomal protein S6